MECFIRFGIKHKRIASSEGVEKQPAEVYSGHCRSGMHPSMPALKTVARISHSPCRNPLGLSHMTAALQGTSELAWLLYLTGIPQLSGTLCQKGFRSPALPPGELTCWTRLIESVHGTGGEGSKWLREDPTPIFRVFSELLCRRQTTSGDSFQVYWCLSPAQHPGPKSGRHLWVRPHWAATPLSPLQAWILSFCSSAMPSLPCSPSSPQLTDREFTQEFPGERVRTRNLLWRRSIWLESIMISLSDYLPHTHTHPPTPSQEGTAKEKETAVSQRADHQYRNRKGTKRSEAGDCSRLIFIRRNWCLLFARKRHGKPGLGKGLWGCLLRTHTPNLRSTTTGSHPQRTPRWR